MYTKKVVLTTIDEFLFMYDSAEYSMFDISIDEFKCYYNTKLSDLDIVGHKLTELISYLEDELCVTISINNRWKTINDICNAFRLKIEKNKD